MFAMVLNILYGDKEYFLPGNVAHGHSQIESLCDVCHLEAWTNIELINKSCTDCHNEQLDAVDNSHPIKLFNDPRYVKYIDKLDARFCVSCHMEHQNDSDGSVYVTVPLSFCILCHEEDNKERKSHEDFSLESCGNVGCHNYHDNRMTNADYLVSHAEDNQVISQSRQSMDNNNYEYVGNTNCNRLNDSTISTSGCIECHSAQGSEFLDSKYGLSLKLASKGRHILPEDNRAIFISHSHATCSGCHEYSRTSSSYDSIDICLSCHSDEHSLNYLNSKHYRFYKNGKGEQAGLNAVSCAACHMPRVEKKDGNLVRHSLHNTGANLWPKEHMIQSVCIYCHNLQFSIDSMADADLRKKNFIGKPTKSIKSIKMAVSSKYQSK